MLTIEQLELRRLGIGGSDVGSILGLNKYASPLDVYLEKTGKSEPKDLSDNEAVHFGNVLEDVVAQEYARRTGLSVRRRNRAFVHPDNCWMRANIDRSVDGKNMVLECKTAGQYMTSEWGASGSDEVPDTYLVQVAWYMAVCGYSRGTLAVLIGGRDFRIYNFERDTSLEKMLVDRCEVFWRENVLADVPPPASCLRDLETLYATDNGLSLVADDTIISACGELSAIKKKIKHLTVTQKDLELQIKTAMGSSAEVLLGDEGRKLVTWKSPKAGPRLDGTKLKKERPEIWGEFAPVTQGSRRFLLK